MTDRRAHLRLLVAWALMGGILPSRAQSLAKLPRVVLLLVAAREAYSGSEAIALFRRRLRELGYIDGKSVLIEERYAEGDAQRLVALAREVVESKADIIVTPTIAASKAARQATSTIPIVMVHAGNPVGAGLIANLARPGGNVTGTTNMLLGGKQIELIRELVPRASRLGVLINPTNDGSRSVLANMTDTARSFGIDLVVAEVTRSEDLASAFAMFLKARLDGLVVMVEKVIYDNEREVLQFAASARLPAAYDSAGIVIDGGLISYGPVLHEQYAVAAEYVDKILRGANPGDLPVQQPTRYELFVNLTTAKALGLTIPQSLQMRAQLIR